MKYRLFRFRPLSSSHAEKIVYIVFEIVVHAITLTLQCICIIISYCSLEYNIISSVICLTELQANIVRTCKLFSGYFLFYTHVNDDAWQFPFYEVVL